MILEVALAALLQAPPPPVPMIREPIFRFASGSTALPPYAAEIIADEARAARSRNATRVVVTSSTDTAGSSANNRRLSRRRAEVVRDVLIREGVEPGIIVIEAYGEDRLVVQTGDGVAEPANRFVQIAIES